MTTPKVRVVSVTVRTLRTRLALTREQFATRLGVTWSTVNCWENGRVKPSPLGLQKIRNLLGEIGRVRCPFP
jgi:putative transcriptional regulator